ncbi:uncharacterized protein B0H18DRAFT_616225 [Fomitopsis serialis]|uniref:uncharacterized protein n=1 Tax=Fomitopsis serialis TaxID=139415 RepID=UPI00200761F5|nr:uncharacterized protein B0H18DRAFT_616225 [Neoantrodia serialis]KAH9920044.1 hypothetical protein B0H18DRAFT_616225 [Neoantrodia serialis]
MTFAEVSLLSSAAVMHLLCEMLPVHRKSSVVYVKLGPLAEREKCTTLRTTFRQAEMQCVFKAICNLAASTLHNAEPTLPCALRLRHRFRYHLTDPIEHHELHIEVLLTNSLVLGQRKERGYYGSYIRTVRIAIGHESSEMRIWSPRMKHIGIPCRIGKDAVECGYGYRAIRVAPASCPRCRDVRRPDAKSHK